MADENLDQRLTSIEAKLDGIGSKLDDVATRLGRQVAVTEALRSDMRLLTGIAQSTLTALQAIVGGYADLSSRITDLENPATEG